MTTLNSYHLQAYKAFFLGSPRDTGRYQLEPDVEHPIWLHGAVPGRESNLWSLDLGFFSQVAGAELARMVLENISPREVTVEVEGCPPGLSWVFGEGQSVPLHLAGGGRLAMTLLSMQGGSEKEISHQVTLAIQAEGQATKRHKLHIHGVARPPQPEAVFHWSEDLNEDQIDFGHWEGGSEPPEARRFKAVNQGAGELLLWLSEQPTWMEMTSPDLPQPRGGRWSLPPGHEATWEIKPLSRGLAHGEHSGELALNCNDPAQGAPSRKWQVKLSWKPRDGSLEVKTPPRLYGWRGDQLSLNLEVMSQFTDPVKVKLYCSPPGLCPESEMEVPAGSALQPGRVAHRITLDTNVLGSDDDKVLLRALCVEMDAPVEREVDLELAEPTLEPEVVDFGIVGPEEARKELIVSSRPGKSLAVQAAPLPSLAKALKIEPVKGNKLVLRLSPAHLVDEEEQLVFNEPGLTVGVPGLHWQREVPVRFKYVASVFEVEPAKIDLGCSHRLSTISQVITLLNRSGQVMNLKIALQPPLRHPGVSLDSNFKKSLKLPSGKRTIISLALMMDNNLEEDFLYEGEIVFSSGSLGRKWEKRVPLRAEAEAPAGKCCPHPECKGKVIVPLKALNCYWCGGTLSDCDDFVERSECIICRECDMVYRKPMTQCWIHGACLKQFD